MQKNFKSALEKIIYFCWNRNCSEKTYVIKINQNRICRGFGYGPTENREFSKRRPSESAPHRARLGVFFCGRFAVPLLERVRFAPFLLAKLKMQTDKIKKEKL